MRTVIRRDQRRASVGNVNRRLIDGTHNTHSGIVEHETRRSIDWDCSGVGSCIRSLTSVKLDGVEFGLSEEITCLSTELPARHQRILTCGMDWPW